MHTVERQCTYIVFYMHGICVYLLGCDGLPQMTFISLYSYSIYGYIIFKLQNGNVL